MVIVVVTIGLRIETISNVLIVRTRRRVNKMDTVEELVESYINGNIGWVREKLKSASKIKVLRFAQMLTDCTIRKEFPEDGIEVTIRLLEG